MSDIPITLSLPLILAYLLTLVLTAEVLSRFASANGELTRKIVHIGSGNVVLLAWWFDLPVWIGIGAAILAGMIALLSYTVSILPSLESVGRKSLGTFFYALSFGTLFAWFWQKNPEFAILGILIMAWGDGLAAIVGQNFGKHPYYIFGGKKSLEGSLAILLVSCFIAGLILGSHPFGWLIAVVVALCAAGLETFSFLGIDNLLVPIGSAACAFWLTQWLG